MCTPRFAIAGAGRARRADAFFEELQLVNPIGRDRRRCVAAPARRYFSGNDAAFRDRYGRGPLGR
jgi:hypothetical protein